jgi:hypothetical protein
MKIFLLSMIALVLAFSTATAQDAPATPPSGQTSAPLPLSNSSQLGWRAGTMGGMVENGMGGRGVTGTVAAVAADHYTVKTDAGQIYVVHLSADTRILKQTIRRQSEGGSTPQQTLSPSDIKVGDAIAALGSLDAVTNAVAAVVVVQIDPERAQRMREQQADFGKTWLMGRVTAISESQITLLGSVDNAAHTFQADENTAFRKRRNPITRADVKVGDIVRVEGALKEGTFVAGSVSVLGMPPEGMPALPQGAAPAQNPQ